MISEEVREAAAELEKTLTTASESLNAALAKLNDLSNDLDDAGEYAAEDTTDEFYAELDERCTELAGFIDRVTEQLFNLIMPEQEEDQE